jgi:hypothetical protein
MVLYFMVWCECKDFYGAFVGFVGSLPAPLHDNTAAQWQEFEALLAIVALAHNTPAHEVEWAREAAWGDLEAALVSYREMAARVPHMRRRV